MKIKLSKEMFEEADDTVRRNYAEKGNAENLQRVKEIIDFVQPHKEILDVGSGGFMPIILGAGHACDISKIAGELLEKDDWKGEFTACPCWSLPYQDKEFDVAVCTEVIEHLDDEADVLATIRELDRVSKRWILTTPCASKSGFKDSWNAEKTHHLFLSLEDMQRLTEAYKVTIEKKGIHIFIKKYWE